MSGQWFQLAELLRAHLLADVELAGILAGRVHYVSVPDSSDPPWVYFAQTGRTKGDELGGDGIREHRFALEVVAPAAPVWLDALVARLEAFEHDGAGLVVQLCDVEDADDDYVPRSVGEGSPEWLHTFTVVCYCTDD